MTELDENDLLAKWPLTLCLAEVLACPLNKSKMLLLNFSLSLLGHAQLFEFRL